MAVITPQEYERLMGADIVGMTDPEIARMRGGYSPVYDDANAITGYERSPAATQVDPMAEVTAQQAQQLSDVESMFAPYQEMGISGLEGLGSLMAGEYTPSEQMQYQMGLGEAALAGGLTAGGLMQSSAAQKGYGDLYADLLSEDIGRQTQDLFGLINVGQGALGQIGQAAQSYQQNMANIFGSQAASNAAAALAQGQQQANLWGTLGSAGAGLGQYMMGQPQMNMGQMVSQSPLLSGMPGQVTYLP